MDDPPPSYEEAIRTSAAQTSNRSAPTPGQTNAPHYTTTIRQTKVLPQPRQQPPYTIVENLEQPSNMRSTQTNIWLFLTSHPNCLKCLRILCSYVATIFAIFIIGTIISLSF